MVDLLNLIIKAVNLFSGVGHIKSYFLIKFNVAIKDNTFVFQGEQNISSSFHLHLFSPTFCCEECFHSNLLSNDKAYELH